MRKSWVKSRVAEPPQESGSGSPSSARTQPFPRPDPLRNGPTIWPLRTSNGPYRSARIHRNCGGKTQEKLKKNSRISQLKGEKDIRIIQKRMRMPKTGPPQLPWPSDPVVAWVRYRPKLRNTGRESLKDLAELKDQSYTCEAKGVARLACGSKRAPLQRHKVKTGRHRLWVKTAALVLFSSA